MKYVNDSVLKRFFMIELDFCPSSKWRPEIHGKLVLSSWWLWSLDLLNRICKDGDHKVLFSEMKMLFYFFFKYFIFFVTEPFTFSSRSSNSPTFIQCCGFILHPHHLFAKILKPKLCRIYSSQNSSVITRKYGENLCISENVFWHPLYKLLI